MTATVGAHVTLENACNLSETQCVPLKKECLTLPQGGTRNLNHRTEMKAIAITMFSHLMTWTPSSTKHRAQEDQKVQYPH